MAKFAVGMRVRLVMARTSRVPVGAEGRIIEIGEINSELGRADCAVVFTGFQNGEGGDDFCSLFSQLEPILPEGAAPSIYSYQELMDKLREGERV